VSYIQTRFVVRAICRVLVLHAHVDFQIKLSLGGDREEYRTKTRVKRHIGHHRLVWLSIYLVFLPSSKPKVPADTLLEYSLQLILHDFDVSARLLNDLA
jgi:hypothetical protein